MKLLVTCLLICALSACNSGSDSPQRDEGADEQQLGHKSLSQSLNEVKPDKYASVVKEWLKKTSKEQQKEELNKANAEGKTALDLLKDAKDFPKDLLRDLKGLSSEKPQSEKKAAEKPAGNRESANKRIAVDKPAEEKKSVDAISKDTPQNVKKREPNVKKAERIEGTQDVKAIGRGTFNESNFGGEKNANANKIYNAVRDHTFKTMQLFQIFFESALDDGVQDRINNLERHIKNQTMSMHFNPVFVFVRWDMSVSDESKEQAKAFQAKLPEGAGYFELLLSISNGTGEVSDEQIKNLIQQIQAFRDKIDGITQ